MNNQKKYPPSQNINDYQTDFVKTTHILYKRKWLIITGTAIFTIMATVISLIIPKIYMSEGFYQLSGILIPSSVIEEKEEETNEAQEEPSEFGKKEELIQLFGLAGNKISVPEYKKFSSIFTSPERFVDFLEEKKIFETEELNRIKSTITSPDDLSKWMKPVYSYSKEYLWKVVRLCQIQIQPFHYRNKKI